VLDKNASGLYKLFVLINQRAGRRGRDMNSDWTINSCVVLSNCVTLFSFSGADPVSYGVCAGSCL
jgi:hypothetical protein